MEDAIGDALRGYADVRTVYSGPVYRFPRGLPASSPGVVAVDHTNAHVFRSAFDDLVEQLDAVQPCVAKVADDRAVAICQVVRRSVFDLEAGVETLPHCRRRGYGAEVVAAWAALVRQQGMTPLYSASWNNVASIALAARLQLVPIAVDISVA